MKVITLTLAPAFDKHCFVKNFAADKENIAELLAQNAGGKGINISRALKSAGTESLAVLVTGKENEADFCAELEKDAINFKKISVPGRIRENLTVHTENAGETRISFSGFSAADSLLDEILGEVLPYIEDGTIFTFTGSVPPGISMPAVFDFLDALKNTGAKIAADSRSLSKSDLFRIRPWLIKPNAQEISAYLGKSAESFADVREGAAEFCAGGIENVLVSLGKNGALLARSDEIFTATPPQIKAVSAIGAGDSMIAGFIAAHLAGLSPADKLKTAVSYGSAACLTSGTNPPLREDAERLFKSVDVNTL